MSSNTIVYAPHDVWPDLRPMPQRAEKSRVFRVILAGFILFALPLSTVSSFGDNLVKLALSDCAIPIVAACLLYYFATSRLRLPYLGLCLGHISLCILSALFNFSATLSLGRIHLMIELLKPLIGWFYFYGLVNLVRSHDDLAAALVSWKWGAVLCSALGIAGVFLYTTFGTRTPFAEMFRAQGTLEDANLFACHVSISIFLVMLLKGLKRGSRMMTAITTVALLVGLILSASRGGVLAFLCAFTVFQLTSQVRRWRLIVGLWIVPIVLLGLSVSQVDDLPPWMQPAAQRLTTLTLNPQSEQGMQRSAQWEVAWGGFVSSPLIGIGRGNYKLLASSHATYLGSYAHNTFIGAMCDLGIPGLVCYLLIFLLPCFPGVRNAKVLGSISKDTRPVLIAGCCLFVVVGLTINIENYRGLWAFAALAVAMPRLTGGKEWGSPIMPGFLYVIPDKTDEQQFARETGNLGSLVPAE